MAPYTYPIRPALILTTPVRFAPGPPVPFFPPPVQYPNYYAGCYTDRRRRFEYRAWRRGADYFAFGAPASLLWLDYDPDVDPDYEY